MANLSLAPIFGQGTTLQDVSDLIAKLPQELQDQIWEEFIRQHFGNPNVMAWKMVMQCPAEPRGRPGTHQFAGEVDVKRYPCEFWEYERYGIQAESILLQSALHRSVRAWLEVLPPAGQKSALRILKDYSPIFYFSIKCFDRRWRGPMAAHVPDPKGPFGAAGSLISPPLEEHCPARNQTEMIFDFADAVQHFGFDFFGSLRASQESRLIEPFGASPYRLSTWDTNAVKTIYLVMTKPRIPNLPTVNIKGELADYVFTAPAEEELIQMLYGVAWDWCEQTKPKFRQYYPFTDPDSRHFTTFPERDARTFRLSGDISQGPDGNQMVVCEWLRLNNFHTIPLWLPGIQTRSTIEVTNSMNVQVMDILSKHARVLKQVVSFFYVWDTFRYFEELERVSFLIRALPKS